MKYFFANSLIRLIRQFKNTIYILVESKMRTPGGLSFIGVNTKLNRSPSVEQARERKRKRTRDLV
jgi:hypothetical protein